MIIAGCTWTGGSSQYYQASAAIANAPPMQRVAAQVVQEDQTEIQRWMEYARTCEHVGNYGGAIGAYNYVIVLSDHYMPAYEHLAVVYARTGQLENAMDACRKGLALDDQRAALWLGYGLCLCESQQYAEALNSLRRAMELTDEPAIVTSALLGCAKVSRRRSMHEQAQRFVRLAVGIDPQLLPLLSGEFDTSTAAEPEARDR
jgi:Tfp pilus assembly protein PilF